MSRAWVIALLLAGCYRPAPSPGAPCPDGDCPSGQRCVAGTCRADGDPTLDAEVGSDAAIDAPDAATDPLGMWSAPVLIPGVNSNANETDPSITADRLTIAFASNRPGGLGSDDIYLGTRASTAAPFTVAAITAINSPMRDRSPEISPDGNTIYFTSNRGGDYDVYASVRSGGVWSAPQPVAVLSSAANEGDVAISPDGLTALVERSEDLYLATRPSLGAAFAPPVLVPVLDVTGDVASPSLTDDAASVYLHGGGTRDLYVAYRQGNTFTVPVRIPELTTGDRDAAPFISPDGKHLVFERDGDLYETSR
jgi:hypothetical protein